MRSEPCEISLIIEALIAKQSSSRDNERSSTGTRCHSRRLHFQFRESEQGCCWETLRFSGGKAESADELVVTFEYFMLVTPCNLLH